MKRNFYEVKRAAVLNALKHRARKKNIPFDLELKDIFVTPNYCPVLGIKLAYGHERSRDNSPSVDRIDNSKGYTKDNIIIVSNKANRIKSNGTVEDLRKVYEFYKNLEESKNNS